MRTNIVIDDELLKAAQKATGLKTKKAVVEEGLRRMVTFAEQVATAKALRGAADWQGDLMVLRENRDIAKW
jgi:Arc/MetJ family transcription regulator